MLDISGPIGPAVADYVTRGIKQGTQTRCQPDYPAHGHPGWLGFVDAQYYTRYPDLAAASGQFLSPLAAAAPPAPVTYILYASHIAAMAPGTNLGAATPVSVIGGPGDEGGPMGKDKGKDDKATPEGDAMQRKVLNDAVAYIKSLARMRGRNADWAVKAVREAASLPAEEAVKLNVVDLMAQDIDDLLKKIHGRKVSVAGHGIVLKTKNLAQETIAPDWRSRFLAVITNPTLIPILFMFGILGILYEIWNPGFVFPGVFGGICLLLVLYAVQVLPVSYAGLALLLLGISFMVAEAFVPSFGALGIGGVVAFVAGSIMLMDTDVEGYSVYLPAIVGVAVSGAVLTAAIAGLALKARQRVVVSGQEEMIGDFGQVSQDFVDGVGRVWVHSEDWRAQSKASLQTGQKIKVTAISGLTLHVEPID